MNTLEVLQGVRELLSEPRRWTQGKFAGNADEDAALIGSNVAVCWCLVGAINRESPARSFEVQSILLRKVGAWEFLIEWNDDPARTHAEVLALLDRAIEEES